MNKYDLIIIGFGKAGKTLAKFAAAQGQQVAMIEQSSAMYGGTCINIGLSHQKYLFMTELQVQNLRMHFQEKKKLYKH